VLLLDIVPFELNEKEQAKGLTREDKVVRNRLVNDNLKASLKSKPSPIYSQKFANRIATGNLEDDIHKIKDVDWIIEVVVERLDIKQKVFEQVEKHVNDYVKYASMNMINIKFIPNTKKLITK
uniref:3-hydroxyacyl-CoA dehydrogenase NAD-binding domain-containing protein n=1 Tax=Klebsiella pneumoniae TaxID=573 RepID=UPI00190F3B7C